MYRSVGDENISEEIGRQFDFMREDFKLLFQKQKLILKSSICIMDKLGFDPRLAYDMKSSVL